ncbi:hypothetical protein ACH6CV_06590 [Bacillota bacterium Meth-B3]|nr:hypothetical protein [Christensenellaceae bacterium]
MKAKDGRAERLRREKERIRERHSRFPLFDWFRRAEKPERVPGVELEKHDVLAMILAALSLVVPWVLGLAAAMALVGYLMKLWMG